jgi:hypothetical protein
MLHHVASNAQCLSKTLQHLKSVWLVSLFSTFQHLDEVQDHLLLPPSFQVVPGKQGCATLPALILSLNPDFPEFPESFKT